MTKNIVVNRSGKTNSFGLLKQFSQKVRSSGIIPKIKSNRYSERKSSAFRRKFDALRKIARKAVVDRNLKLGKKDKKK
ncbi:MAG: 30S ribosomal protein S21 [Candidatus Pacebacteria bacterium]|nr:30S ribosomal protein S21 [Candidatus Paceibacterota bacterium]